jgi:hypothetical protein
MSGSVSSGSTAALTIGVWPARPELTALVEAAADRAGVVWAGHRGCADTAGQRIERAIRPGVVLARETSQATPTSSASGAGSGSECTIVSSDTARVSTT